jgi:iron complex transport system substrate-binding protein
MQGSNNTANKEEIIKRGPDIILYMTQISDTTAQSADDIQDGMRIPVVTVDYSLGMLSEAYKFVGGLIGVNERAEALADYCERTYTEAVSIAKSIPEQNRVTVYYAQGTNGLQTAPRGSAHSQVIDAAGGKNVVELAANTDGRLTINMEQLILYDPEVILLSYSMGHEGTKMYSDAGTLSMIQTDERWSNLNAVKNGKVYTTPCYPYNWQDMPPSANRVIGLRWLSALLYPDHCDIDIREATLEFYSLFYQIDLTDEQIDILLNDATEDKFE